MQQPNITDNQNYINMSLRALMIVGILLSTIVVNAQTNFRPGYVITNLGDTLYGEIDYRGDILMNSICTFKTVDNEITKFSPYDIHSYRFIDSKYYISREVNSISVFLEYLINGELNIYYARDETGDHYYLDKAGVKLTEIPYEEGIRYINKRKVYYETRRHYGLLKYYMQDAPEFQSHINKVKKPEHKSLIQLAEDYHNFVCKGEECIIYEKKLPFIKVNFEPVLGVVIYKNEISLDFKLFFEKSESAAEINPKDYHKPHFQSGVLTNFWLPRTNEKIYFRTGILLSQIEKIDGEMYTRIRIPTHIGYIAPNTYRIRPSFSIGLASSSYSGGVMVKLNKQINFGFQTWLNFTSTTGIPWIPSQLYSYSFLGSLYFEL